MDSVTLWIIAAGAVVTYLTRVGGLLLLLGSRRIHPRVEAGLDAVPAAVLTTLVAPATIAGGPFEWIAIGAAIIAALRGGLIATLIAGAATLILLRNLL